MTPAEIQALSEEVANDPLDRNYAALDDYGVALDVDTAYRPKTKASVESGALTDAIVIGEYNALTESQQGEVREIISLAPWNPAKFGYSRLVQLFGSNSVTAQQLADARTYYVTRWVDLEWSTKPNIADVQAARALIP